jgi:DNA polymerase-3 subunit chi
MTEIRFYHLERSNLDQVLPQLVGKAMQTGQRILIKAPDSKEVERLNEHLWTFDPNSFLPHGSAKDGNETDQPVFITDNDENPNAASILFLTHDLECPDLSLYQMVCEIFDGRNEQSLTSARTRWKAYKEAGHDLAYWQQGENGWEKKI